MPPTKKAAPRRIPRQVEDEYDGDDEMAARAVRTPAPAASDDGDDNKPKPLIRRGMSAARQVADSTSSFAQALKLTEMIQVFKFLEDDPYANYLRHWIERMTPTGRSNRSYNCMHNWADSNDRPLDCPLCDAGDKAQSVAAWNVALIGDDGVPSLKTFDCGPKLLSILEGYARDPKVAPLTKGYFLASRSGKKGTVNYQIPPISAASLLDQYDIEVPSPEELKKLGLYDMSIVTMPKMSDMKELAAEIADEY